MTSSVNMLRFLTFFLGGLVYYNLILAAESNGKNKSEPIVLTHEWQSIGPDTVLPRGVHARINLSTGVKEAKLIDKSEIEYDNNSRKHPGNSKENSLSVMAGQNPLDSEDDAIKKSDSNISLDELKAKLKKIKSDNAELPRQSKDASEDHHSGESRGFRNYSELKKEFDALNLTISTDSEVLSGLFESFEILRDTVISNNLDSSQVEDVLEILKEMEYHVHQVDNGQLFADMEGMTKVISPCLNSTEDEVKSEALKVLGAAVQSNPKVQLKALESDLVKKLLHMLSINNAVDVKSKGMFALGALIRNFPPAQIAFVKNRGLELFGKILTNGHFRIQTRIVVLINDLLEERQDLQKILDDKLRSERIKLYDSTNFEKELVTQKYCQNIVDLSIQSMKMNHEIDDFHEILYENLIYLGKICKKELAIKREDLLIEFQKMSIKYHDFPRMSEDGENLNAHHVELIKHLQTLIGALQQHDEL